MKADQNCWMCSFFVALDVELNLTTHITRLCMQISLIHKYDIVLIFCLFLPNQWRLRRCLTMLSYPTGYNIGRKHLQFHLYIYTKMNEIRRQIGFTIQFRQAYSKQAFRVTTSFVIIHREYNRHSHTTASQFTDCSMPAFIHLLSVSCNDAAAARD